MLRWLLDNLSTLALAFILALFVWFVAVRETNPIVEESFPEAVPITILNQPAGTQVINNVVDSVEVVVRGPRQEVEELQTGDFEAIVDLSTIPLGGADVELVVTVRNPLVEVVDQSEDEVFIRLDEYLRFTLPITPTIVGEAALGHVVGEPTLSASEVVIEGPTSRVGSIQKAIVQVSIEGARETLRETVSVRLRDASDRSVVGVDSSPAEIQVTVPITKSDEYAELLVSVNLTGTVATGYRLANFSVDPQKVTIFGPPEIVASLPGFVSTDLLDITDADQDFTQRVGLLTPEGVTLIGGRSVVVDVDVEPVLTTSNFPWRPTIIGPDQGLTVTILPETVNVALIGPVALMDGFDPETDLSLTLNLLGLAPGSYQIEPEALSNILGVQVEGLLPPSILVEIFRVPTPTPTPVITGTPTITSTLLFSPIPSPAPLGTPVFLPTATPSLTPTR